jgi:hypothetical protein
MIALNEIAFMMDKQANTERRTPSRRKRNAQRSRRKANAQRPTPNAQRSMKKGVFSLRILLSGPDADEENSDKFISLAKDG